MKRLFKIAIGISVILFILCFYPTNIHSEGLVFATSKEKTIKPMMAIVIDDFGGYDRSGVKNMLSIDAPLTCAIMPNLDYSIDDMENALRAGKEVILHMPMQSHVNLPADWYGPVCILNSDSPAIAISKLEKCLSNIKDAKGFNIHIGSGVCQNKILMNAIIDYANEHNLLFLDSRTHIGTTCEDVAKDLGVVYLGRDEFLEPDHNKSYEGVRKHLLIGKNVALEKGYSVVIGHVGAHGGENTAKAIKDTIQEIENSGVQIVSLSTLHNYLKQNKTA